MRTLHLAIVVLAGTGCAASPPRPIAAAGAAAARPDCRTAETCFARIELTSAGIAVVAPDAGVPIALVHVRATLINTGRHLPWRFDPAATVIAIGTGNVARPVLANADVASLPIVMVEPGTRVIVDLFAVPPGGTVVDPAVVGFGLRTRIATPDRTLDLTALRAPRVPGSDRAILPGSGSTWWADPRHAWSTFDRSSGAIATRRPAIVTVIGVRAGTRAVPDR